MFCPLTYDERKAKGNIEKTEKDLFNVLLVPSWWQPNATEIVPSIASTTERQNYKPIKILEERTTKLYESQSTYNLQGRIYNAICIRNKVLDSDPLTETNK